MMIGEEGQSRFFKKVFTNYHSKKLRGFTFKKNVPTNFMALTRYLEFILYTYKFRFRYLIVFATF